HLGAREPRVGENRLGSLPRGPGVPEGPRRIESGWPRRRQSGFDLREPDRLLADEMISGFALLMALAQFRQSNTGERRLVVTWAPATAGAQYRTELKKAFISAAW